MTYLIPGEIIAIRVDNRQEVEVVSVQHGLVSEVVDVFRQLVDGVQKGGRAHPLAGVDGGVEEHGGLAGAVGQLEDAQGATLGGRGNRFNGGDLGVRGHHLVQVGLDLEIITRQCRVCNQSIN